MTTAKPARRRTRLIPDFLLLLIVHWDAFRIAPRAYLTATKWWILRKRVRARGQFAVVLGQSPHAYRLWGIRSNQETAPSAPGALPPIIALVEDHGQRARRERTLASLAAEGIEAVIIGPHHTPEPSAAAAQIDWQAAPWLMPISAGDTIAPGAAAAYREAMSTAQATVIYADDDVIDRWGYRSAPHFKPDWNAELFRHCDYLTGACMFKGSAAELRAVSGERAWAAALVKTAAACGHVHHLRRMLHHRAARQRPSPVPALAQVERAAAQPLVSIIIPTRNGTQLLRTCLAGLGATQYRNLEIIIADNDSDDPETLAYLADIAQTGVIVLPQPGPFNYSAINNRAVEAASGDLICLLNNDIEILAPDWLAIMVSQAMRPDVGAVGAQLLYPDGRIQHAGVVIGVGNAAGHAHRFLRPEEEGYFCRHALPQFVSAVTAACLVVRKDRFLAAGGLDEVNFPVAFNDVDLCLRLNQRGWQSFYEPRAVLVHHESVSRGFDLDPVGAARFAREMAALQQIWRTDEICDPFHHPYLSRAAEQFTMALS